MIKGTPTTQSPACVFGAAAQRCLGHRYRLTAPARLASRRRRKQPGALGAEQVYKQLTASRVKPRADPAPGASRSRHTGPDPCDRTSRCRAATSLRGAIFGFQLKRIGDATLEHGARNRRRLAHSGSRGAVDRTSISESAAAASRRSSPGRGRAAAGRLAVLFRMRAPSLAPELVMPRTRGTRSCRRAGPRRSEAFLQAAQSLAWWLCASACHECGSA